MDRMRQLYKLALITMFSFGAAIAQSVIKKNVPEAKPDTAKVACDCMDAIKINLAKATMYGKTLAPQGYGKVQELKAKSKTDKLSFEVEHNTAWYLLNPSFDGELIFDIIPTDSSNDYDFLVYKYTDSSFCGDILTKKIQPIRSNLSRVNLQYKGLTGLSVDSQSDFVSEGKGDAYSKSLLVKKGEKYILVLDNVYPNGNGHLIKFNYIKRVVVSGKVVDKDSIPLKADVVLSDNEGKTVRQIKTNDDGTYKMDIGFKEDLNYYVVVSTDSSFTATEILNTRKLVSNTNKFTDIHTVLAKLKKGEKYRMQSLNFEGGTDVLLNESLSSLFSLYMLMKKNKNMVIRIEGHVNGPGVPVNDPDNQKLSTLRAQKVYDYLVNKGISKERIGVIGFSNRNMLYPKPINEFQNSANRRVEINVISIN